MPSLKRKFGDQGEDLAEKFLVVRGYKILDRNFRIKNIGEIDIIGEKNNTLVFFEIKTRSVKHETDYPIHASINYKKKIKLKRICELYIIEKQVSQNKEWRVDGVFINFDQNTGLSHVEHLENILWESYY